MMQNGRGGLGKLVVRVVLAGDVSGVGVTRLLSSAAVLQLRRGPRVVAVHETEEKEGR